MTFKERLRIDVEFEINNLTNTSEDDEKGYQYIRSIIENEIMPIEIQEKYIGLLDNASSYSNGLFALLEELDRE